MTAMFPMFIEKDELRNEAVVFLKPHADSDACEKMLVAGLEAAGCTIESKRRISGAMIEEQKLIDAHYGSLAEAAMSMVAPTTLEAAKAIAFSDMFGVEWSAARKALNPVAMAELRVDGRDVFAERLQVTAQRIVGSGVRLVTLEGQEDVVSIPDEADREPAPRIESSHALSMPS